MITSSRLWKEPSALQKVLFSAALPLCVGAILLAIVTPLDLQGQLIFGVATIGLLVLMKKNTSRRATYALALLSLVISTRYIYWRATETLAFDNPFSTLLGIGLFLAELYAWIIMVLGYVQYAWPLERKPVPLPANPDAWPTVDVYIPTYNESLSVVGDTVLAALNMDYPRDKMRVFLLDDGRREEFRAFAEEVGCEYVTRPDNKHAKAGNLNHAMTKTHGDFICIFDCDHVPTRAFLQLTLGWLVNDERIALVQTPHHFYSPEPFQRNTPRGRDLPSEGELFYGVIQPGNDFWDAAYFCGSCAVIRRAALDDVGGFAGETVTEDAHTALKMQKRGWQTAYLNIPLAAGLATEKLALHIGQRVRWARGMTQILRVDNPLFGGKMKLTQRLCYLTAILHFQFPLSRLVFLTSPLAYLLMGQYVISASAMMIAAYALPHLVHNAFTNARLQGKFRHAFWGEVYEIALSFHLLLPTLVTLINPRRGKFNVTDKGGLLDKTYFDWRLVLPHLAVAGLLICGIVFGFARYYLFPGFFPIEHDTMWLNTGWSVFNLVLLFSAVAVAMETRQIRKHVRFPAEFPVTLHLMDGRSVQSKTIDVSMGGIAVSMPHDFAFRGSAIIGVELPCGPRMVGFPVRVVQSDGKTTTLSFLPMSLAERRDLVNAIMGRADAWIYRRDHSQEGILKSWANLVGLNLNLAGTLLHQRQEDAVDRPAEPAASEPSDVGKAATRAAGLLAALGVAASLLVATEARAREEIEPTVFDNAVLPTVEHGPATRAIVYSLKALGAREPVRLSGPLGEAGFPVTFRQDEVVTSATLSLSFAHAPDLPEEVSSLTILLNGEPIGSFKLSRAQASGVAVEIPINRAMFLTDNRLSFRFESRSERNCDDPANTALWTVISNTASALSLTVERFATTPSLSRLPEPFFDPGDMSELTLPFVYASAPGDAMLRASATVSSYFGTLASYRGFRFPVSVNDLPVGNAIVFATAQDRVPGLTLPRITGPMLAVVPNPRQASTALLLVLGRDGNELEAAARALALGTHKEAGAVAVVQPPAPVKHVRYDAPRWLPTGKQIALGSIPNAALSLQGDGVAQGLLTADFRIPPDLFIWPRQGLPLRLNYRYPSGDWIDAKASRLDVLVNNTYLRSFSLEKPRMAMAFLGFGAPQDDDQTFSSTVMEIQPYYVFGQNQLQFYFDLKPKADSACGGNVPKVVRTSIEPDTTLDLTHVHHFGQFPNLAYFASAGFPFTRLADLSDTAVILTRKSDVPLLSAFLELMGRFGDATGVPVTGLTIAHGLSEAVAGKDILVVGSLEDAGISGDLLKRAPFALDDGTLRLKPSSRVQRAVAEIWASDRDRNLQHASRALMSTPGFTGMASFRSPFGGNRVVVALLGERTDSLPDLVRDLGERSRNERIQGDLSVWTPEGISSFSVGQTFWTGNLPPQKHLLWFLSREPLLVALGLMAATVLMSTPLYWRLRRRARRRLEDGE